LYFGKKKKDKIQNKSFPVLYFALCFTASFRYFSEILNACFLALLFFFTVGFFLFNSFQSLFVYLFYRAA